MIKSFGKYNIFLRKYYISIYFVNWQAKLLRDYPKTQPTNNPKAEYYRQNMEQTFKKQKDIITRNKSDNPELQKVLNRKKKLEEELRELEATVEGELKRLENRGELSNLNRQLVLGRDGGRLFNIILTRKDSDEIIFSSSWENEDEDVINALINDMAEEYIDWEKTNSKDIYIFWSWYKDGNLRPMTRRFIMYIDDGGGKLIYNRLYDDAPPQFLIDRFGEDEKAMDKFLRSYGLTLAILAK